ncbi:hypothetical protein N7520_003968 [Penicillium odoratum]|uniref:uncharacterized protein n=1 Tax=Penicillium odoratum TaxID=1167516 RepID=UPI00254919D7|nr:uncharacterized protein N7520_003968 [Penicillium odoratum]KAJ5769409.1 hypothetical protein N7520_003968 [Penicillium odoratum]
MYSNFTCIFCYQAPSANPEVRNLRILNVNTEVLKDAGDDAQKVDVREAENGNIRQLNVNITFTNAGRLGGGDVDGVRAGHGEGLSSAGGWHREKVHASGQGQLVNNAVKNGLDVDLRQVQETACKVADSTIDGELVDESADDVQDGDAG